MKKHVLSLTLLLAILFISYDSITYSTGPPEGYSNAPGEGNCANPGCHGGNAITSGTIWGNIDLTVTGNSLSSLIADSTYTLNLTFSNPSSVRYGFQLCVLESGATALTPSLGTLINTTTETQIVSSPTREYMEHTASGTSASSNTKTWSFDWQVPSGYVGGAVFYVVINSTNNDNSNSTLDTIFAKTFSASISLPVTWLSFNAIRKQSAVVLTWHTASERDADRFEVERSLDGKEWKTLGRVKAAGQSAIERNYKYVDAAVKQNAYYRLKQVDYNGSFEWSKVVTVSGSDWESELYFNREACELYKHGGSIGYIELYSQMGVKVWSGNINGSTVTLPELPKGIYFLRNEQSIRKLLF